jgi:HEAT repeat protein
MDADRLAHHPLTPRTDPADRPHQRLAVVFDRRQPDDQGTLDWLIAQLHDPDWQVRELTVQVLQHHPSHATTAALTTTLGDPDSRVRAAVLPALRTVAPQEATELLIPILRDGDAAVRRNAAYQLGELGQEVAIEPLITAAHDVAANVRQIVALALMQFRDQRVGAALSVLTADPDEAVQAAACFALQRWSEAAMR